MPPADDVTAPPHRLPDETQLGVVHLQVTDLAHSLAYYQRVVGLMPLTVSESDASLGGPSGLVLVVLHERRDARAVARHSRLGLYHFAILLPDRPSLGRFLVHLASINEVAATADHGVSEAVYLWDPDGLGIEVYADRPRAEWRYRGAEIQMTTEPLDVRALMASAAGQRWVGLPAGTVMGHMHLHVGSITEAAAFYHHGLGLDRTVSTYPGALFMSAGGYHHHLGVNTWAGNAPRSTDRDARLLEWTIELPTGADADAIAARLESAGYVVRREGSMWRADDTWGTTVCLSSR